MSQIRLYIFFFIITAAFTSFACETPVFRYAMERWGADNYPVKLVYSGELNAKEKAAADYLKKMAKRSSHTNLTFTLEKKENVKQARIEVFYPQRSGMKTPIWTKEATLKNAKEIIDSPAREKVRNLLYKSTPCVFAFFKSGDKAKDDAAEKVLKKELEVIARKYSIPQLKDENGKYKIKLFNYVAVEPSEQKEDFFRAMAFNLEEKIPEKQPVLLPIFGQGRTLYLIVGKGINRNVLEKDCDFIMGKCSCVVKDQNPGADLLFQADWAPYIGSTWIEDEVPDEMSGVGDFIQIEELPPLE